MLHSQIFLTNWRKKNHFIIPFGKFGPLDLGKATAAARAALPSPTSACWVVLCFHDPPNSDTELRIFNMRTWSFLCMCIHMGVGHTNESAQHFWLSKTLTIFFTVLLLGFKSRVFGSRVRRCTNWVAPSPLFVLLVKFVWEGRVVENEGEKHSF